MVNFSKEKENEFIGLLSNAFENAQTFNQHKNQSKMKQRKQYETFFGDGYILEYILIQTKWAGDNDTPPAEDWEIENVSIQKENGEYFDLPFEFIERFNINDKLINYDY